MLLKQINENYFKIVIVLILLGLLFFVLGLFLGDFHMSLFVYPGNMEHLPWYWFLVFR